MRGIDQRTSITRFTAASPIPRRNAGESAAPTLLILFLLATVITAVMLPAYRSYTLNEHRRLAQIVLRHTMDNYRTWRQSHPAQSPSSFEDLGFSSTAVYVFSDGTTQPSASISAVYRVSLSVTDAPSAENCGLASAKPGFILVAEPVQTQRVDAQCGRLCLSSSAQRGVSGRGGVAQCWSAH